jgi:hypothetical protein
MLFSGGKIPPKCLRALLAVKPLIFWEGGGRCRKTNGIPYRTRSDFFLEKVTKK